MDKFYFGGEGLIVLMETKHDRIVKLGIYSDVKNIGEKITLHLKGLACSFWNLLVGNTCVRGLSIFMDPQFAQECFCEVPFDRLWPFINMYTCISLAINVFCIVVGCVAQELRQLSREGHIKERGAEFKACSHLDNTPLMLPCAHESFFFQPLLSNVRVLC